MRMLAKLKLIWAQKWEQNASLLCMSSVLLFEIITIVCGALSFLMPGLYQPLSKTSLTFPGKENSYLLSWKKATSKLSSLRVFFSLCLRFSGWNIEHNPERGEWVGAGLLNPNC